MSLDDDMKAWQEKRERIDAVVENIPDEEALDWLHALRRKFGWAGTMFTDEDIRIRWQDLHEDDDDYAPMTDEQVDAVMSTYYWAKAMDEQLCENGWIVLDMALDEVMG